MELFIEKLSADRRLSQRHTLKAGLRVRVRRSDTAERRAESENLSQRGVFFATDLPLSKGGVARSASGNTRGNNRSACSPVAVHRPRGADRGDGFAKGRTRSGGAIRLLRGVTFRTAAVGASGRTARTSGSSNRTAISVRCG